MYLAQNFCHITYNRSCPNGENLSTASKTRLQYFSFFFLLKINHPFEIFEARPNRFLSIRIRLRFFRIDDDSFEERSFFFFNEKKTNVVDYLSFFLLQNFVFRLFFNRKKFRSNEIVPYRILKLYSRNKLWLKYGKGINSIHFDFIAPFFSFSIFISIIR